MAVISATTAEFRKWVEVKSVVGSLGEFSVFDNFSAEEGVEGVEEAFPIGGAMEVSPDGGDFVARGECGGHVVAKIDEIGGAEWHTEEGSEGFG